MTVVGLQEKEMERNRRKGRIIGNKKVELGSKVHRNPMSLENADKTQTHYMLCAQKYRNVIILC